MSQQRSCMGKYISPGDGSVQRREKYPLLVSHVRCSQRKPPMESIEVQATKITEADLAEERCKEQC